MELFRGIVWFLVLTNRIYLEIFEELDWFQILSSRRQVADLTFLNKLLGSHLGFPALLDRVNQETPSCTRSQRLFEVGHQFRSYVCPEAFPVQERELHIGRLLLQLLSWGYQASRFWNFDTSTLLQLCWEIVSVRPSHGFWAFWFCGAFRVWHSWSIFNELFSVFLSKTCSFLLLLVHICTTFFKLFAFCFLQMFPLLL